jgi:hypothetical protein
VGPAVSVVETSAVLVGSTRILEGTKSVFSAVVVSVGVAVVVGAAVVSGVVVGLVLAGSVVEGVGVGLEKVAGGVIWPVGTDDPTAVEPVTGIEEPMIVPGMTGMLVGAVVGTLGLI